MSQRAVEEQVLTQYRSLVLYHTGAALKRLPPCVQSDDLFSIGQTALIEAHRRFDQTRGLKFITFATFRVRGAIQDYIRCQSGMRRRGDAPVQVEWPANSTELTDGHETPDEHATRRGVGVALRSALARLPKRERRLMELYYFGGLSQPQIARRLRCSESRVGQLRAQAVQRMRAILTPPV